MRYEDFSKEDFDAIVTGELTHYSLWMENEINHLIINYFIGDKTKSEDFYRFVLHREGLTFQNKLEIARGMIPILGLNSSNQKKFNTILKKVEEFKSWRNSMAHGLDIAPEAYRGTIIIQTASRSGKEKTIEITPKSHIEKMNEAEELYQALKSIVNLPFKQEKKKLK